MSHNHDVSYDDDCSYGDCPACRDDRRSDLEDGVAFWGGTIIWHDEHVPGGADDPKPTTEPGYTDTSIESDAAERDLCDCHRPDGMHTASCEWAKVRSSLSDTP